MNSELLAECETTMVPTPQERFELPMGDEEPTKMMGAFSLIDGGYIGNEEDAKQLQERGIAPQRRTEESDTCSIGFCEKEQKWYGWSHRAIYGFGIGDVVEEGDVTNSSGWTDEYLEQHPELDTRLPVGFKAETLEDAKRMAIAFAEGVS